MRGPKLRAAVSRRTGDSTTAPVDTLTETATNVDDLDDWKSSLDGSEVDRESLLTAERTVASLPGAHAGWHDCGDVMPYKAGCVIVHLCMCGGMNSSALPNG